MSQELKPCPLCGKQVIFSKPDAEARMDGSISCFDCNLNLEISHAPEGSSKEEDERRWQEAVARWNWRV